MISKKSLNSACSHIFNYYGIELNWSEKVYVSSCIEKSELNTKYSLSSQSLSGFTMVRIMENLFGLDQIGFGMGTNGKGLKFLGKDEFKEYCKRHVDEWREERYLI